MSPYFRSVFSSDEGTKEISKACNRPRCNTRRSKVRRKRKLPDNLASIEIPSHLVRKSVSPMTVIKLKLAMFILKEIGNAS